MTSHPPLLPYDPPSSHISSTMIPVLQAMYAQEESYRSRDYLGRQPIGPECVHVSTPSTSSRFSRNTNFSKSSSSHIKNSHSNNLSEVWRRKICEWKYQLVDYYNIDREIVAVSMNHLDRYISLSDNTINMDKKQFQLAAMTCLFLATKIYEPNYEIQAGGKAVRKRNKISISTLVELSRGFFDRRNFIEMEQVLLFRLSWRTVPPTAVQFIQQLLDFLVVEEDKFSPRTKLAGDEIRAVYESARYLAELSVCVYDLAALQRPSSVAIAAIWNALLSANVCRSVFARFRTLIIKVTGHCPREDVCVQSVYKALESLRPGGNEGPSSNDVQQDEEMTDSPRCDRNGPARQVSQDDSHDDDSTLTDYNSPVCVSKGTSSSLASSRQNDNQKKPYDGMAADNKRSFDPITVKANKGSVENSYDDDNDMSQSDIVHSRTFVKTVHVTGPPRVNRVACNGSGDECPWNVPSNSGHRNSRRSGSLVGSGKNSPESVTSERSNSSCSSKMRLIGGSAKVHPMHGPYEC